MKAADKAEQEEKAAMAEAAKGDTLFQRKYIIPFILAVVILACTQATGINSVLNYSVKIFQQAGLQGEQANIADLAIKVVNMVMTMVAVALVDKKGRKFLLMVGTTGIIVGLVGVGAMFLMLENKRVDITEYVNTLVQDKAYVKLSVEDAVKYAKEKHADQMLPEFMNGDAVAPGMQLIVTYQQGSSSNQVVAEYYDRAPELAKVAAAGLTYEDNAMAPVDVTAAQAAFIQSLSAENVLDTTASKLSDKIRTGAVTLPEGTDKAAVVKALQTLEQDSDRAIVVPGFAPKPTFMDYITFWNDIAPTGSLQELTITRAEIGMKPDATTGWIVTVFFIVFIAFYAAGPGVCVWLALSELMPTRIRANGIPVVRPSDRERQAFDLILDCAGAFAAWDPAYGFVELTRSGVPCYARSAKPVYVADGGRIKRIETMLGTGESYFRTMAQLGYTEWKDRRLVVFGSGKVGSGIVLYAHRHGARISIVTEPESLSPAIGKLAAEVIDCRNAAAVGAAVRGAYAVVTATGHKGAFQESCPAEAWRSSGALMANMGVEDEYGPGLPPERVLNGKKTLNFILEEPTHLKYIDATLALHNEGALYLATHPEARGLMAPEAETEERLLQVSIREGVAGEEIALLLEHTPERP